MTIRQQLIATLKCLFGDQKDLIIALVNPLKSEAQQIEMLEYVSKNKDNKESMRKDCLLKKALEISKK